MGAKYVEQKLIGFFRIQGARREHNGLRDQRATQKTEKKTLICLSYFVYVPYLYPINIL